MHHSYCCFHLTFQCNIINVNICSINSKHLRFIFPPLPFRTLSTKGVFLNVVHHVFSGRLLSRGRAPRNCVLGQLIPGFSFKGLHLIFIELHLFHRLRNKSTNIFSVFVLAVNEHLTGFCCYILHLLQNSTATGNNYLVQINLKACTELTADHISLCHILT